MPKLSPRLQLIYDQLIPGKPVWDLCCDHGHLGINAYKSGQFPEVHFVDQVQSIIQKLKVQFEDRRTEAEDLKTKVFFHPLAAEKIKEPVEGSLVIAGVGGAAIADIVRALKDRGQLFSEKLIFCPQKDDQKLSELLLELNQSGFTLRHEPHKILERGRTRKLLIFDKN